MAPIPKKTSRELLPVMRRKVTGGKTPKQIIESLTRDGDYALFDWSQRMSIRRYADYEQLKVKVMKLDDGRGCVERIYNFLDDDSNLEQTRLDILAAENKLYSQPKIVDNRLPDVQAASQPLIDILNQIMRSNPDNIDLQDRILNALFDYNVAIKNIFTNN